MSEPWRRRIALVVGVSEYKKTPLKNAARDARDLEKLLVEDGGFQREDVDCLANPTRVQLMAALGRFQMKIRELKGSGPDPSDQGCLALFFYAGHGLIDNTGEHYLLPQDWTIDGTIEWALETYGCKLSKILKFFVDAYAGIVLIDACREMQQLATLLPNKTSGSSRSISGTSSSSSSSSSPGLQVQAVGQRGWGGDAIGKGHYSQNLLVGHACAPRRTASDGLTGNGTYTEILLEELCNPAHRHVMDALLEANVKVYEQTKDSTSPQQPRLDLSAKAGLFDSFRLERLPLQEATHLTAKQRLIRDWLQQMSDPAISMDEREDNARNLQKHIDIGSRTTDSALGLLADLEGVPLLLGVLRDTRVSASLRLATCKILAKLAAQPQHRELLAAKGAGPILLQQFTNEAHRLSTGAIQAHNAAWEVLNGLSLSKVAKVNMLHHGGVAQLVECLASCCGSTPQGGSGNPFRSTQCIEYACTAFQLLHGLLSDHCYMHRYRRRAAASLQLREKLKVVLDAVATHRNDLQDDTNGTELLEHADKLKSTIPL